MKKYNYTVKCDACESEDWEVFSKHAGFEGDEIIVFVCKNCGHRQQEKEILVLKRRIK